MSEGGGEREKGGKKSKEAGGRLQHKGKKIWTWDFFFLFDLSFFSSSSLCLVCVMLIVFDSFWLFLFPLLSALVEPACTQHCDGDAQKYSVVFSVGFQGQSACEIRECLF